MDDTVKLLWDLTDQLAKTNIMYLNFYNFNQPPFQLTPDPNFLLLSPTHNEALLSVIYGIENRKGFVVLSGEVGTGKTTIIRSYLESREQWRLQKESSTGKASIYKSLFDRFEFKKVKPVYIFFTADLAFADILKAIAQELNFTYAEDHLLGMVRQLNQVLLEEYKQENYIALIIDEAQNMSVETLEQLRMLSNLETNQEKLIQIVLVGQPELREKLNREELRQLKQRIEIQAWLKPLNYRQSIEYIHHRISRVMTETVELESIISKPALKKIVLQAKGIPRIINVLCDKVLIAGYNFQQKPVTLKAAEKALPEEKERKRNYLFFKRWAPAAVVILGCAGLAVGYRDPLFHEFKAVSAYFSTMNTALFMDRKEKSPPSTPTPAVQETRHPAAIVATPIPTPQIDREKIPTDPVITPTPIPGMSFTSSPLKTEMVAEVIPSNTVEPTVDAMVQNPTAIHTADVKNKRREPKTNLDFPITRIIKPGDSLASLCVEMYGFCNNNVINLVRKLNPQISDVNLIWVDDKIIFPSLSSPIGSSESTPPASETP